MLAVTHDPAYLGLAAILLAIGVGLLVVDLHRARTIPTRPCRCAHCRGIRR